MVNSFHYSAQLKFPPSAEAQEYCSEKVMCTNRCFWEYCYRPLSSMGLVSLTCWMVEGGAVLPSMVSPQGIPKKTPNQRAPQSLTSHPGFLPSLLQEVQGSHLENRQFFLCWEMSTCWHWGWMQFGSFQLTPLLKNIRNFFFSGSVLKLLSQLLFLLFVFIAFCFLHPSVHKEVQTGISIWICGSEFNSRSTSAACALQIQWLYEIMAICSH